MVEGTYPKILIKISQNIEKLKFIALFAAESDLDLNDMGDML